MNEGFSTPCASPEHKPHVVLLFLCFIIEGELGVGRDDSNLPQVPVGDNAIDLPLYNCLGILVCTHHLGKAIKVLRFQLISPCPIKANPMAVPHLMILARYEVQFPSMVTDS